MTLRQTKTYALLAVSEPAYTEIRKRMIDAGYGIFIRKNGDVVMDGVAIETETQVIEKMEDEEERLP